LLIGLLLGTLLRALGMKAPPVRNLATAYFETLMQAATHYGLAFAVGP
jgi:hypothetical protein